jgi:type II secretory ATPase GspE/PulE/Tfp pilus assembly ATPase PilB-like protein
MLLLDLFVSQNKLTDKDAQDIEAELIAHEDVLVDTLLLKKNIKEEEISDIRSILYGLPVYKDEIKENKDLTKYVSITQSKQLLAVPLELKEEVLSVGVVDPDHANVLDSLQFLFGTDHQPYKVYLITYSAYKKHFGIKDEDEKASITTQVDDGTTLSYVAKEGDSKDDDSKEIDLDTITSGLDKDLAKLPVPEIFSIMLRYAIDNGASDIHIEHVGASVRARCRMDGRLEIVTSLPPKLHPMIVARVKILCSMKLDEKRKPQDGRFSTKFGDHKIDYRVSTFPGYYGEKVVIRILDSYRGVHGRRTR